MSLALAQRVLAQATTSDTEAEPQAQPHLTVSLQQMQAALAQRFPLRYPVPGLLNLDVQTPRLQLLPAQNRLAAAMDVQAAGAALQRSHQGTLELDFALRYEASDRSIRAHQLRLRRLQFPTLQPPVVALLNGYAPALAEQSLLEVVLHRLSPKDLALPDTMGLQPGSLTVTDAGVVMGFVTKPL
ncbi:DUF1439 domain-containing protein [Rhodoferax lacus]|nr:DUF1439 domain-containing protein [Rhodoferax lacus]